jgi:ABC-type lipoprotein export system ATPase subunit
VSHQRAATARSSGVALLRIDAVAKQWGASSGLAAVTTELRGGELVALQGRSGSGKSTLLSLLAGWCTPDAGRLERIGPWAAGDRWATWSGTAIVPQVLGLADELPVEENLGHVLRLAGVDRRTAAERVEDVLVALDLAEQRRRLPREISLGQQQRVAVGRAVIAAPVVLLADEPTCHQDPEHATAVLDALRRVADDGGAVLVASHDAAVAAAADRVVSLDE